MVDPRIPFLEQQLAARDRQISGKDSRITELERSELRLQAANARLVARCSCACCGRKDHTLAHNRDTALSCNCANYPESERCDCYYCQLQLWKRELTAAKERIGELKRSITEAPHAGNCTWCEWDYSQPGCGEPHEANCNCWKAAAMQDGGNQDAKRTS